MGWGTHIAYHNRHQILAFLNLKNEISGNILSKAKEGDYLQSTHLSQKSAGIPSVILPK